MAQSLGSASKGRPIIAGRGNKRDEGGPAQASQRTRGRGYHLKRLVADLSLDVSILRENQALIL